MIRNNDELISDAVALLNELYPERIEEISTTEEKHVGNLVYVDRNAQVIIEFLTTGHNFQMIDKNRSGVVVRFSKVELVDGAESRISTAIDLEDVAVHVVDEYRLLETALKAQRERNQK